MGIQKTRQILVDVARQLFAKDGKDNVTMNDIATASQKGRRTLYTYFRNKNEIYHAVIEKEIKLMQEKLQEVLDQNLTPDQKLISFMFVHLRAAKEALTRNGSLRADFFRDIYEVEYTRRRLDVWEVNQLKMILDEGVECEEFEPMDTQLTAQLVLYSLKGIEQPYFRDRISEHIENRQIDIIRFLYRGFSNRKNFKSYENKEQND